MVGACAMPPEKAEPGREAYSPPVWTGWGKVAPWGVVGAALFLLFFQLGRRELDASHEARAALNAQWYLDHRQWGPSHLPDGTLEAQKPPGYYWAVAAGTRWLGLDRPNEWTTRLPAALSGLAVVGALLGLTAWRGCRAEGLLAALLLLTMAAFVWLSRTARTDAALSCAIALGLLALEGGRGATGWSGIAWWMSAAVCFAWGWLVKGPMAVVLPGAVLACRLAMEPKNQSLWRWVFWCGCALLAGSLAAWPWYLRADWVTDGQFGAEFFGLHHVGRGLGGSRLRGHPFWFYLGQLPLSALPASLLIPAAGWFWWHRRTGDPGNPSEALGRWGLAWVLGGLVLLSLARFKRADYLAPLFPGLALWLGCALWPACRKWASEASPGKVRGLVCGAACGLGLWSAGWVWWAGRQGAGPADRAVLAETIRMNRQAAEGLVFFQVEDHLLAHALGLPFETVVTWSPLLEAASRSGGVVVVTEPERLAEGWFVAPAMRLQMIARSQGSPDRQAECKPLVCVRLEASAPLPGTKERADAAVPTTATIDRSALHAGGD